jgi:hypothetical protein
LLDSNDALEQLNHMPYMILRVMTSPIEEKIDDWQKLVNKPVFAKDGKDVGVVESVQAERIIVTFGPITPDKYAIPKSSIVDFDEGGVVRLKEDGEFVDHHYKFA